MKKNSRDVYTKNFSTGVLKKGSMDLPAIFKFLKFFKFSIKISEINMKS